MVSFLNEFNLEILFFEVGWQITSCIESRQKINCFYLGAPLIAVFKGTGSLCYQGNQFHTKYSLELLF